MVERGTYRKIAEELSRRIDRGELQAGSLMPSESSLKAEFGVARETVRQALDVLATQGLIDVVPGKGRYVRVQDAPDSTSRQPASAYERIAEDLRRSIVSKTLAPGAALPSENALVDQYGVSRGTVRRALALLASEGYVTSRHGSGTFVTAQPQSIDVPEDSVARP